MSLGKFRTRDAEIEPLFSAFVVGGGFDCSMISKR